VPELPEVETIKNDLKSKIVGKTITDGWSDWPKMIKQPPAEQFFDELKGLKITDVRRRAKNLIFDLSNGLSMLAHLKMTGHFLIAPSKLLKDNNWQTDNPLLNDRVNQFIHLALYLDDGDVLAFSDMRKFGWIKLMTKKELDDAIEVYGPEPLEKDFNLDEFKEILSEHKGAIKKVLLDQHAIAGIGNIYADEICWEAKINPFRQVDSLNNNEIQAIYKAIKTVLTKAVKLRGTSTSDYRDTSGKKGTYGDVRNVYRLTGEPCPRDGTPIERKKLNGRSTHFCPKCQK
jgi:formamidopyrimidine-DNA glycosylase